MPTFDKYDTVEVKKGNQIFKGLYVSDKCLNDSHSQREQVRIYLGSQLGANNSIKIGRHNHPTTHVALKIALTRIVLIEKIIVKKFDFVEK